MKYKLQIISSFAMAILGMISCGVFSPSSTPQIATPTTPSSEAVVIPTDTTTSDSSATPALTLIDLEIVEWFEYLSPRRADPSNTDITIQILVHNPNNFPVHVNTSEMEFRLRNAAGEIVYTVGSSYFSLWEGTWMLAGDSTGFQICACFQSSGLETQEWETIELFAPIEPATDVAYTTEIEATLGEPIDLAEAHLGGSGTGIPIIMKNTSNQALESIPMRVIARDSNGRYIGMVGFGNSVVSFTQSINIQPGDSLDGILDSEIDYFDGPLTYEVVAIGIIAQTATTPESVLPSGTPLAVWQGIPIMPSAISGETTADVYQFTIRTSVDEVANYYKTELPKLGFNFQGMEEGSGYTSLYFSDSATTIVLFIAPLGDITGVAITISK
jgi:hypothetical protein